MSPDPNIDNLVGVEQILIIVLSIIKEEADLVAVLITF